MRSAGQEGLIWREGGKQENENQREVVSIGSQHRFEGFAESEEHFMARSAETGWQRTDSGAGKSETLSASPQAIGLDALCK